MKTIGLACDHAGFELKEYVRGWLEVKAVSYTHLDVYKRLELRRR